jgi:exopolysaccharide/PEP-CTERM locus tyrosine autokinase
MTLVERAIEKLRRAAAEKEAAAPTRPVGAVVTSIEAPGSEPAVGTNNRRIVIDRDSLREAGYLPESSRDRQFSDHYRQIKRPLVAKALAAAENGKPSPRVIMMASALPGDGKTFTSINLALSLARERDVSVVLMDADVPKPHVSRIFGVDQEPGLLDALGDAQVDVESLLLPTDIGSLSILPAGTANEGATELLASARMQTIVARLLARNPRRIVLFDSPPLLVSSESRALSNVAGQTVLVVRSGTTPKQAVLDALELLGDSENIALVLNQGRTSLTSGYYAYGEYRPGGNSGEAEPKQAD